MTHFNTKHGMVGTKVYDAWSSMLKRCRQESHPYFAKYGGRGIKVCERWHDFANFYADMGEPEPHLSLDRIDNNGDYTLNNCRWATKQEQSVNRSNTRWIEHAGEKLHLSEWARRTGLSKEALHYRIKRFGVELALTTPSGRKNFAGVK